MITCIVIDDEPKALEVIERYCQKSSLVNLKASFREPVKAIGFLNREKIDLIFLDINMPDITGIQLIQTLATKPIFIRKKVVFF
jgi:two-component system, LytTR family, response regulator